VVKETAEFETMVGRRSPQENRDGDDESARMAREKEGLRKLVFEPPYRNPADRARPKAPQSEPEIRRRRGGESVGADKRPPRDRGRDVASARAKATGDAKSGRTENKSSERRRTPDAGSPSVAGRANHLGWPPAANYVMAAVLVGAASLGAGFLSRSDGVEPLSKQRGAEIATPKIEPEPRSAEQHSTPGEVFADSEKGAQQLQRPEPAVGPTESPSSFPSSAVATATAPPEPVEAPQSAVPPDQSAQPSAVPSNQSAQPSSLISVGGAWFFDDRAPPFVGSIDREPWPSKPSVARAEAKRTPEPAPSRSGRGPLAAPQPEKGAPPRAPAAAHASSANSGKKKPVEPPVAVGQDRPLESRDDNRAEQTAEPAPPPPEADEYKRASLQEALEFVADMLKNQRPPEGEQR